MAKSNVSAHQQHHQPRKLYLYLSFLNLGKFVIAGKNDKKKMSKRRIRRSRAMKKKKNNHFICRTKFHLHA